MSLHPRPAQDFETRRGLRNLTDAAKRLVGRAATGPEIQIPTESTETQSPLRGRARTQRDISLGPGAPPEPIYTPAPRAVWGEPSVVSTPDRIEDSWPEAETPDTPTPRAEPSAASSAEHIRVSNEERLRRVFPLD